MKLTSLGLVAGAFVVMVVSGCAAGSAPASSAAGSGAPAAAAARTTPAKVQPETTKVPEPAAPHAPVTNPHACDYMRQAAVDAVVPGLRAKNQALNLDCFYDGAAGREIHLQISFPADVAADVRSMSTQLPAQAKKLGYTISVTPVGGLGPDAVRTVSSGPPSAMYVGGTLPGVTWIEGNAEFDLSTTVDGLDADKLVTLARTIYRNS